MPIRREGDEKGLEQKRAEVIDRTARNRQEVGIETLPGPIDMDQSSTKGGACHTTLYNVGWSDVTVKLHLLQMDD